MTKKLNKQSAYFKLKHDQNDFAHDKEKLKEVLGVDFLQKFIEIRDEIVLDNNMETFENKMHLFNDLLYEKNMFLRLYEKKAKFRYLFKK